MKDTLQDAIRDVVNSAAKVAIDEMRATLATFDKGRRVSILYALLAAEIDTLTPDLIDFTQAVIDKVESDAGRTRKRLSV